MKNKTKKDNNVYLIAAKYYFLEVFCIIFLIISQYLSSLISLYLGQALGIFAGETEIFLPKFLAVFINTESRYKALVSISISFVVVGVIMVIFRFIRTTFRKLFVAVLEAQVSSKFLGHSIRLPKWFLSQHSTGDIIQRNIQDSKKFASLIGNELYDVLYIIINVAVLLFNIFYLSLWNFSVSLVVVVLVVTFELLYSILVIRKKEIEFASMLSSMDTINQQSFSNIMMIKSFNGEEREYEKLVNLNNKTTSQEYTIDRLYAKYWLFMDILTVIYNAVMIVLVGWLFIKGHITFGITTSLVMYNAEILDSTSQLMERINRFIRRSVSPKRISEYLVEPDDFEINGTLTPEIFGDIEFKDVSMKYEGSDTYSLKNLSFHITPGQKVGIFGKSGSGKSTLLNILARLDEYEGSILLDGVELNTIEKHYLRENLGYVNQESFIFSDTVKNNILQLVDDGDYESYSKKVCLDDDVKKFKDGYDTVIGERGVTLSGGQKQRISIARTLIKDKNILILDDCLSAVDNNVSKEIANSLKEENKTTFIVSHNLIHFIDADIIFVLEDGEITKQGTHEQLIKEKGIYKTIWNLQQKLKGDEDEEE